MMQRAIFGLLYDYSQYAPTDEEMGITEDMKGTMTDLQTLGGRILAHAKKKKSVVEDAEKPLCYDCPSELWCGDCPDNERCSDGINCFDCGFEDGCQNELPAAFPADPQIITIDKFAGEDTHDDHQESNIDFFKGENEDVHYPPEQPVTADADHCHTHPLPAKQLEDGSWMRPDPKVAVLAKDLATAPAHLTDAYPMSDELAQTVQEAKLEAQEELAREDLIDHPSHYAKADIPSGIECWDWYELAMTEEEFIGHMKGNVLKYVFRAGRKEDGKQDLEKAGAYLKRWLSYLDGDRTVHLKGKYNDG
jgi:hypothetical protein